MLGQTLDGKSFCCMSKTCDGEKCIKKKLMLFASVSPAPTGTVPADTESDDPVRTEVQVLPQPRQLAAGSGLPSHILLHGPVRSVRCEGHGDDRQVQWQQGVVHQL
jgi:hypothetical protein